MPFCFLFLSIDVIPNMSSNAMETEQILQYISANTPFNSFMKSYDSDESSLSCCGCSRILLSNGETAIDYMNEDSPQHTFMIWSTHTYTTAQHFFSPTYKNLTLKLHLLLGYFCLLQLYSEMKPRSEGYLCSPPPIP